MAAITLDKAELVAFWLESLFYGIFSVLYFICVDILVRRKKKHDRINKPLLGTASLMYLLSTVHMIVDLVRVIQAFIDFPQGALEYYAQIWTWLSIFKQALYGTNNIIADGLVIYRCYVVWGHSYRIIIVPIVLLIATSVSAYTAVYNFSQVHPGQTVFAKNIVPWGTALFSLSFATNVTVTSLIAVRIWWLAKQARVLGKRHVVKYRQAAAIIIESGAIYSACIMTLLILYCQNTNAQYIVYDSLSQVMGIVPTMIIVRVGLGISTQDVGTFAATTIASETPSGRAPRSVNFRMEIGQTVHVETDAYELDGHDETSKKTRSLKMETDSV